MSAFIDAQKELGFAVELICRTLGESRSAHYERRGGHRSPRVIRDEQLVATIRRLHEANFCAYGYRKMHLALRRAGVEDVGRDRIKRLMREHAIQGAKRRGKPWRTTTADPEAARRPDRVGRDFTAAGSQYTGLDFAQVLDDYDVLQSVGSVGDAYDNALAESFVDTLKTELIADRVWRTRSQLELAIVEYLGWFNHDRLHESLGDVPPAEFEALYAPNFFR